MKAMLNIVFTVLNSIKTTVRIFLKFSMQFQSMDLEGQKLGRRMQRSQDLGIFCDIINDEMDAVKDLEKLPGLASITPEFKSDDLQQHRDSR